jgi:hypothetical protein
VFVVVVVAAAYAAERSKRAGWGFECLQNLRYGLIGGDAELDGILVKAGHGEPLTQAAPTRELTL